MALINTRFPAEVAYGTSGGPRYNTEIVTLDDGDEQRLSRWPIGRHYFNARGGINSERQYMDVVSCFRVVKGRTHTFRVLDRLDYKTTRYMDQTVSATDCELIDASGNAVTGDGATTVFYLAKKYTFGASTVYRPITLPVAATTLIAIGGVTQTIATDYTLDDTTGAVTFTSPPAGAAVLTCGTEFDVPCRFDVDDLAGEIVDRGGDGFWVNFDIPLIEA